MTQIFHSDGIGNRSVHRQFLDLVLADDQLVQAEFEAIVAHEWDCAPPAESVGSPVGERFPVGPSCRRLVSSAPRPPGPLPGPGKGEWSRQRSPPRATQSQKRRAPRR